MPNVAPVIVASAAVPTDAPLSKLIAVLVARLGALSMRVLVAEVIVKLVPFSTLTLKSVDPSMLRNCSCISAAKSVKLAEAGEGARL